METFVGLIISILPVYLVLLYIYKKDDRREPRKLLKRLFLFGVVICIPVALIELALESVFPPEESMNSIMMFIYVLIDVALIEEIFKWFIVYILAYNHKEFDQIYDAIVYAVFVSLGFACLENILYVLDSGITVGIIRAITAIPGHASDAIIMGNYLGLAKVADLNGNVKLKRKYLLLSILMPTLMHGIYDYCIFSGSLLYVLLFIGFLIFIYIYSIKKVKRVSSNNHDLIEKSVVINEEDKYCKRCGAKCWGNYCHKCGTKL